MNKELKIVEFIRNNKDWENILGQKPYCITVSRDVMFGRNLVLLKYNQIESDFNNVIVRECRGIVLDEDTLEVVSHAFDKFGNYGESYCPEIDWKNCYVTEKLDGCVKFDTMIRTTSGDVTIKDICDNPGKYKVLSFNHDTQEIEPVPVEATSIKDDVGNWYNIELEDGRILTVTGNHRIWCNNLNCYRRVDDLGGSEDLTVIG